jgi:hypothetical protein
MTCYHFSAFIDPLGKQMRICYMQYFERLGKIELPRALGRGSGKKRYPFPPKTAISRLQQVT